ncbi:hypothetical protein E5206_03130 [Arthrobacter sp. PAMC25564]|uniref:hypothetical protein n=1 Tax=Arthrobacter sp. PAMC25564 TaxID=2565366 RepID=UPI0010A26F7C|nr:hypothetical protein [Arthrobacter sp. PAMC25564]QCB96049.1 hypothetical protein E5206_03130 [Arthrobacter sp. PAMC25564]
MGVLRATLMGRLTISTKYAPASTETDTSMIRLVTHQLPEAKREAPATFSHHGATATLGR